MILSRAGRLSLLAGLLCLLLVGFTGAANAVIRWDVFPSPTEVINIGRSEVLGSITFVVQPNQAAPILTGNSQGGPTQIGIIYNNGMMVDNDVSDGIRIYSNVSGLAAQIGLDVRNIDITGSGSAANFAGFITLNIPAGQTLNIGDTIRLDGVRGRIAYSSLLTAGNDGYAQMQSVNDPAGNQFFPETVRVAKSFVPLTVAVASDTGLFCLPTWGGTGSDPNANFLTKQVISVSENFVRAFVALDSGNAGAGPEDRVDSTGAMLGTPNTGTRLRVGLNSIPGNVDFISWPTYVPGGSTAPTSGAYFKIMVDSNGSNIRSYTKGTVGTTTFGNATADYQYYSFNQTGYSDVTLETYNFMPALGWASIPSVPDTSSIRAGAALYPAPYGGNSSGTISAEPLAGVLYQPYGTGQTNSIQTTSPGRPRFSTVYYSGTMDSKGTISNYVNDTSITGTVATTQFGIYEVLSPCQCYLLFPYATKDGFWDTGLVVANTSDDQGAIKTGMGAPDQAGNITFWLYDFRLGFVGGSAGVFFKDTAHYALPVGGSNIAFGANSQPIYYAGQSARGLLSELVADSLITASLATKGYTDFAGYIIAKSNFQYCHGYAFIADKTFTNIAQGYVAGVIPDPAARGAYRMAAAAADWLNRAFGESINN